MELRQLRYFVRVVECGSLTRAAADLEVVQSALSQQILRLETELSTRLLRRTSQGSLPTEAGLAFFREAQLTLRHADEAMRAAKHSRLMGAVSVGLAPTACSVLGMPLILAVKEKYPDVRLQIVESLSGHLAGMLNARQLDLAVLYGTHTARRWSVTPLLEERLYLIQSKDRPALPTAGDTVALCDLAAVPLILPSGSHGLRSALEAAFTRAGLQPTIAAEIDSLTTLMESVDAGLGATIQPWAATRRIADAASKFKLSELVDPGAVRRSYLCSLSNDELSPAALAARVVLAVCARELVKRGTWLGAGLSHS
jgi:LysR family transcriptional regulator, regulatory protein for tcuABC